MGVIERRNCGKSVGLCSLFLILSFVTVLSHKLGQVEPLPKVIESTGNVRLPPLSHSHQHQHQQQHKGAVTAITRRISHQSHQQHQHQSHTPSQSQTTTGRDGLFNFGGKANVNRGPSLFLHVPHANGKTLNQNQHQNHEHDHGHSHTHNLSQLPNGTLTRNYLKEREDHVDYEGHSTDSSVEGETPENAMTTLRDSSSRIPTPIQIIEDDGDAEGRGKKSTIVSASTSASTTIHKISSSSSSTHSSTNRHGNRKNLNMSTIDTFSPSTSWKPSRINSNSHSHPHSHSHSHPHSNSNMGDHHGNHHPHDHRATHLMGGFLKREVWTIPLLSIAAVNIFLITLFEIYVLCKARGPSRRHLFLGQMLLFGLFLCSSLALVFAITPSSVGCFLGRLGLGIAYTLIFSVLMVKCIFLLSLDGGIYLPASYQACLLLFSVLVQVAIDTQWVIVYPPHLQENNVGGPLWSQCGTSYTQLLLTLSYNVFLIAVVGILSFKTRGIRENYRESTYIGISILVTIPIWVSWTIAGWILQGRHQDACVAFGLLAQSLATFLIMFMPKGRQLAAMGKEGMYLEDQEDQCSGYSPSFFHFKPSKSYKTALIGDGNVYTTLEPTISTINPNVFFHRSDFHPGMIY